MTWLKTGVVIPPPTELPWVASHAAVPTVGAIDGDVVTVYFTVRDSQRRSHVLDARISIATDGTIGAVDIGKEPLLEPGVRGMFDDSGAMTSCIVRHANEDWLYYQGWALGVTVPFYVFAGL